MTSRRVMIPALLVGVAAGAACVLGAAGHLPLFFRAYLFSWLFCLGLSLGSLCLLMLHNLTGGDWGNAIRPALRAAALVLPFLVLLFVPLLFGLPELYAWARPDEVAREATLAHRQGYLNVPFFIVRAALYFIVWLVLAFLIVRPGWRPQGLSAAGMILYLFTMTHGGFDWIMSRDVEFYSTTFGFIVTTSQTLGALAFILLVAPGAAVPPRTVLPRAARGILNDLGNILLTLVILWTYVSFMQLLVIWMGNSREDNTWYLQRGLGQPDPWRWIGAGLLLCHFFIPFFLLLFRGAKQYQPALKAIAALLLVSNIVENYWLVAPSGTHDGPRFDPHWLDLAALLALFGFWLAAFLFLFARQRPESIAEWPQGVPAHD